MTRIPNLSGRIYNHSAAYCVKGVDNAETVRQSALPFLLSSPTLFISVSTQTPSQGSLADQSLVSLALAVRMKDESGPTWRSDNDKQKGEVKLNIQRWGSVIM